MAGLENFEISQSQRSCHRFQRLFILLSREIFLLCNSLRFFLSREFRLSPFSLFREREFLCRFPRSCETCVEPWREVSLRTSSRQTFPRYNTIPPPVKFRISSRQNRAQTDPRVSLSFNYVSSEEETPAYHFNKHVNCHRHEEERSKGFSFSSIFFLLLRSPRS